jgi:hypothetical protein
LEQQQVRHALAMQQAADANDARVAALIQSHKEELQQIREAACQPAHGAPAAGLRPAPITAAGFLPASGDRGRSRDYERLVQLHQRQVLRRRTEDLAREGLRRWHKIAQDRKRHERLVAHISKTRKERAARQVFTAWRVEIMQQKHQEKLGLTTGAHRRTMARLQSEHQTSENAAKLEMIAMRDNLSKEEERRAILEERLKAAFMRGVCSLNMEAMQVLRSAPQDLHVSVASLLQAINLTSSTVDSGADAEPASTDRLMRHQEALQSQLLEMQNALGSANAGAMVAQSEAVTNPAGGLPSTAERRPYSAGATHHHNTSQQPNHQQQPIRVTMHSRSPNVGLSAGAGAKRAPSASKPKKLMHDSRAGWRS